MDEMIFLFLLGCFTGFAFAISAGFKRRRKARHLKRKKRPVKFIADVFPTASLQAWNLAVFDFAQATQAGKTLMEAGKRHRSEHPLDEETKAALLSAFAQGKPLCCETGLKTLEEIGLDECWIAYLNDWAYENLGCDKFDRPGGCHHEMSLERLRRKLRESV